MQVRQLSNPRIVYVQLMQMLAQLASLGLVHCDYNEFNLLVGEVCARYRAARHCTLHTAHCTLHTALITTEL